MHISGESLAVILLVGLIAGWLAGQLVQGTGFGLVGDLVIGPASSPRLSARRSGPCSCCCWQGCCGAVAAGAGVGDRRLGTGRGGG